MRVRHATRPCTDSKGPPVSQRIAWIFQTNLTPECAITQKISPILPETHRCERASSRPTRHGLRLLCVRGAQGPSRPFWLVTSHEDEHDYVRVMCK